jgi:hypothetical protein
MNTMKSERETRSGVTPDSQQYAQDWWLFAKPRPEMRAALAALDRYIATTETSKHRWFTFLPVSILPDQKIRVIALSDAYHLVFSAAGFTYYGRTQPEGARELGTILFIIIPRVLRPFPSLTPPRNR